MERNKLEEYSNNGLSSYAIAKLEYVSQSTIRYWLKKYDLNTKGWFNYDIIELRKVVNESKSRNEVLTKLNRNKSSSSYKTLNRVFVKYNIDISHFISRSDIAKQIQTQKRIPTELLFVVNSTTSRSTIKKRIINDNLIDYNCFKCGILDIWNNEKLVLILDHINGINNDNRLKNLRFVCPNCNSQLPTHCRKKTHL